MSTPSADTLTSLVARAIRAQSPHNTQAWRFVATEDSVSVLTDWDRNLTVSDPDGREMVIGCGAAVEHLLLLAADSGYAPHLEVTVDANDPRPRELARILFGSGDPYGAHDHLVAAIEDRHTNRTGYRPDPIDPRVLDVLEAMATGSGVGVHRIDDADERQRTTDLIMAADRDQMNDKAFRHELAAWMRRPHATATDGMPTDLLGQHGIAADIAPLAVRTFDVGKGQAARDGELVAGSPHLWLLHTDTDSPERWLATGRSLARLTLGATHHGVAHAYMNQPCEVPHHRDALAAATGVTHPQLVIRMGYAEPTGTSPRRPVDDVLTFATSG